MSNELAAEWFCCILQVSLLCLGALMIGALIGRRRPDITVNIAIVALLVAAGVVIATAFNLPRPWVVSVAWPSAEVSNTDSRLTARDTTESPLTGIRDRPLNSSEQNRFETQAGRFSFLQVRRMLASTFQASVSVVRAAPAPRTMTNIIWTFVAGYLALVALRFVIGGVALLQLRWRCVDFKNLYWQQEIKRMAAAIGSGRDIHLKLCPLVSGPCVSWTLPNTIILPMRFGELSSREITTVLAHELAHICRGDAVERMLAELCWLFVCWHPLAFMLRRQLVSAQELAADCLAVSAAGDQTKYRKGLSMLALRWDARNASMREAILFLGTSVSSSSLIRRIKMLNQIQIVHPAGSRASQILSVVLTLAASLWLSCWSVQAQSVDRPGQPTGTSQSVTDPESRPKEGVRVARADSSLSLGRPAPFSRPGNKPWEALGPRRGYATLRVQGLMEHPVLRLTLPGFWASLQTFKPDANGNPRTFEKFGLPLTDVERIDLSVYSTTTRLSAVDKDGNGKIAVKQSMGIDGAVLNTNREISWATFVDILDYGKWPDGKQMNQILGNASKTAKTGKCFEIQSVSLDGQQRKDGAEAFPTETQKVMWEHVDGGSITAFCRFPDRAWYGSVGSQKLMKHLQAAIGIDNSATPNLERIVVAIQPSTTSDVNQVKVGLQKMITEEIESVADADLADFFRKLEVKIVHRNGHSFVTVAGEVPIFVLLGQAITVDGN